MLVGVPREIKDNEFRVGTTPSSVRELVARGHGVVVQSGAGGTIDLSDDLYRAAGAEIVPPARPTTTLRPLKATSFVES